MCQEKLNAQFDKWAQSYDGDVERFKNRFPFADYSRVLSSVLEKAGVTPGMSVLDLGLGTGNLSKLFLEAGCQILGVDFSSVMLNKAKSKYPEIETVQADLTQDEWPHALNRRFDRIVSSYMFHEFRLETKMRVLSRLSRNNLVAGGVIVIGDIAFPSALDLQQARDKAAEEWEEEFYWVTDETKAVLRTLGWNFVNYQISFCASVYVFEPDNNLSSTS